MTLARARKMLLKQRGAMTLVPELVELIAGEPIKGSWWSHEKGKVMFRVASELEDETDVITAKLIDGKVTFVHEMLWPPLLRVVTDTSWRRERSNKLDDAARGLLLKVERAGSLRADDRSLQNARKWLEAMVLVRSKQEHSPSGKHVTILESWKAWAVNHASKARKAAAKLDLEEALAILAEARIVL